MCIQSGSERHQFVPRLSLIVRFFFFMWATFKAFIEFVTILLLFHVLVFWLWGMWDLSSPTRDWTCAPYIPRRSLNHWMSREVPSQCFLQFPNELMDGIWFTLVPRRLLLLLECSCFFCPSWGRGISYTNTGKKAQAFLWASVAACFYRTQSPRKTT